MPAIRSRQTRQSFQPAKAKRLSEWAAVVFTDEVAIAGASAVLIASFSSASLVTVTPSTLIRIRGLLTWRSDQVAAAEDTLGAVGIALVKERARNAGIASLPQPISDASDDVWLWHQFVWASHSGAAGGHDNMRMQVDGKAMRQIEDGDAIVITAETAGADGASVTLGSRFLFLLH